VNKSTILILIIPPLMWAGNAVIGHYAIDLIPPMLFNFLRWVLVFLILLPLAAWSLRPGSELWLHWRRFAVMGFLSVTVYNSLQYLALHTTSPINVTLIAGSMPVWMIVIGALFYRTPATLQKFLGAGASMAGVLIVLTQGDLSVLEDLRFRPGDLYILLAVIGWAIYSWMLSRTTEPKKIRADWAAMLMAQVVFGLIFSAFVSAGEWAIYPQRIAFEWPVVAVLVFVAIGPAILAYRFWGEGVQRVGPTTAGFFANLTPLFTALLSSAFLAHYPQTYHLIAFALIVGGIWLSALKSKKRGVPAKSTTSN